MSIAEILNKTGQTESMVLREYLILTGLTKMTRYEAECSRFKNKYGEPLESFRDMLNKKRNEEDFEQEDDLMDWEFADAALNWWQSRIAELRHAS